MTRVPIHYKPQQKQLWHIIWITEGALLPTDARGDWQRLADFYAPLAAARAVYLSTPLEAHYSAEPRLTLSLAEADGKLLCRALMEASHDARDRLTGGRTVLAGAFLPTQAHVLFRCESRDLHLVVGRLKARVARILIAHGRWRRPGKTLWDRSFWAAEIVRPKAADAVKAFIKSLGGVQCAVR